MSATVSRWNSAPRVGKTAGCGISRYVLPVAGFRQVSMSPSVATTTLASRNSSSAAASAADRSATSVASSGWVVP